MAGSNSRRAGARLIEISVRALVETNQLVLQVKDDGSGIGPELLERVTDPYATTRTTRPVGLGLPLLKELCELTGGSLSIRSRPQEGTTVRGGPWTQPHRPSAARRYRQHVFPFGSGRPGPGLPPGPGQPQGKNGSGDRRHPQPAAGCSAPGALGPGLADRIRL
jgi:hypothetical protein